MMTQDEFRRRLKILSERMGDHTFTAPSWNKPTAKGMIPDDRFRATQVSSLYEIPPAQAMRCANELWREAIK